MKSGDMSDSRAPHIPLPAPGPDDAHWMQQALALARQAADAGEVPVGAVVVKDGQLLATGRNAPIAGHDPTAHAEIAALRAAALALGNYRLDGCTLYVTLEPCAMCSGAMLHARLARVVYGAPDAKTGAAGGLLNLFAQPGLNHQTQVTGGVLADDCAAVLHAFFKPRRVNPQPLREDALRTPARRFAAVPALPWAEHAVADLPALGGLRLQWGEAGTAQSSLAWLCLHGNPGWGAQYAPLVPAWVAAGGRVLVPDLPGFGRSDKPKKDHAHTLAWHHTVLLQWLDRLAVHRLVLVLPRHAPDQAKDLPDALPHSLGQTLPMALGLRCQAVWHCDLPALDADTLTAPHPDRGHHAGPRAWTPTGRDRTPPALRDAASTALLAQARAWWDGEGPHPPTVRRWEDVPHVAIR